MSELAGRTIAQMANVRKRLDEALVERGLAPTRSRARDAITRGLVRVDDVVVTKPAVGVPPGARVEVAAEAGTAYVSRGALKLATALDAFHFSPSGLTVLDAGASTGGFTEVLIERGARRVHAVDVGHAQLHERLRSDARVHCLEGQDVRDLEIDDLGTRVDAIVADLSFISLLKVLPVLLPLASPGAWMVVLIKPQFEVGPQGVGKGGIVRDERLRLAAVDRIARCVTDAGWHIEGVVPSPISGGSGNLEYLLGARHVG